MFSEHKCGCIVSAKQGQVRICDIHRKDPGADIDGNKVVRRYPANGQMTRAWNGGK